MMQACPCSHPLPSETRGRPPIKSDSSSVNGQSSERMNPSDSVGGIVEGGSPVASRTKHPTPSFSHSTRVCRRSPPECEIPPVDDSTNRPTGGTGLFSRALMCPAIERSSGRTPRKALPSNQTLRGGPGPPIRCNVTWLSVLIPWETKRAALIARTRTSVRPPEPARSLRFSIPELGAL